MKLNFVKNNIDLTSVVIFLSWLSLTSHAVYLFGYMPTLGFMALFLFIILSKHAILNSDIYLYQHVVLYVLLIGILFLLNIMLEIVPNGLLMSPFIAYLCYLALKKNSWKVSLERAGVLIVIFIMCTAVMEFSVKLNIIEMNILADILRNVDEGRIDVFRLSTPFGSPLTLSVFLFYLLAYFLFFSQKKWVFIPIIGALLLTGSRTSFVCSLALLVATLIFEGKTRKLFLYVFFSVSILLMFYLLLQSDMMEDFQGLSFAFKRVLSFKSYDFLSDQSFHDRSNTTLKSFSILISKLPMTLLFGYDKRLVSDSSFSSIWGGSGFLALMVLMVFLVLLILKSSIDIRKKGVFLVLFLMINGMVGGSIGPANLFFFVIVFLSASLTDRQFKRYFSASLRSAQLLPMVKKR